EPACDVLDRSPALDQRSERLRLVGGIHRQAMEVLHHAGLDRVTGRVVVDDEAEYFVIARQDLVVDQRRHRPAAALAGLDLELAPGGRAHDEILQEAARGNAGLELGVRGVIAAAPDIAGRWDELVQRDRLDHGTYS